MGSAPTTESRNSWARLAVQARQAKTAADLERLLGQARTLQAQTGTSPEVDAFLAKVSAAVIAARKRSTEKRSLVHGGLPAEKVGLQFQLPTKLTQAGSAPPKGSALIDPLCAWAKSTASPPESHQAFHRRSPLRIRYPFAAGTGLAIRETLQIHGRSLPLIRALDLAGAVDLDRICGRIADLSQDARKKLSQVVVEPAAAQAKVELLAGGVLRVTPGLGLARALTTLTALLEPRPALAELPSSDPAQAEKEAFFRLRSYLTAGDRRSARSKVSRHRDPRLVPASPDDLARARKKSAREWVNQIGMSGAMLAQAAVPLLHQVALVLPKEQPPPPAAPLPEAPLATVAGPPIRTDPAAQLEAARDALIAAPGAAPAPTEPYVVAEGETLQQIAERRYGSPALAGELAALNGLGDAPLAVGQTLQLPIPSAMQAAIAQGLEYSSVLEGGGALHEIRAEETLLEIAYRWQQRRFPSMPLMQVAQLIAEANRPDASREGEPLPQALPSLDAPLTAGRTLRIPSVETATAFAEHQNPLVRPTTGEFVIWMRPGLTAEEIGARYGIDPARVVAANPGLEERAPNSPLIVPAVRPRLGAFRVALTGEATIQDVAARYGIPVEILLQVNPEITSPEQKVDALTVPGVVADVRGNAEYTIRYRAQHLGLGGKGGPAIAQRLLDQIAEKHQVTTEALLAANHLTPESFARILLHEQEINLVIPERGWIEHQVPFQVTVGDLEQNAAVAPRVRAALEVIAAEYGVSVQDILRASFGDQVTLEKLDAAAAGFARAVHSLKVRVPVAAEPSVPAGTPLEALALDPAQPTITLQEGQTLADICTDLGLSMEAILARNGLDSALQVRPGMVLQIPARSEVTAASFTVEQAHQIHQNAEAAVEQALAEKHFATAVLTLRAYIELVDRLTASPVTEGQPSDAETYGLTVRQLLQNSVHNLDQKIAAAMFAEGVWFLDAWTPPDPSARGPGGGPLSLDPATVHRWAGDGSVSSVAGVISSGLYPGMGVSTQQLLTLNRIQDPTRVPAMVYLKVPTRTYAPDLRPVTPNPVPAAGEVSAP
jgi:LysM repeat protein